MKIKILYVIENVSFAGGERLFAQLINGLDKDRYEIYAACLPYGIFSEKIKNSARILPLSLQKSFNLRPIYALATMIKENHIHIVHSQGARADFFARLAVRRTKISRLISTVQMPVEGYNVNFFKKSVYKALDRLGQEHVDRFIIVSEALRNILIRNRRVPADKVVKIYNGIELDEYRAYPERGNRFREELGIDKGVRLVGAIGRLVWQKGFLDFVSAVKEIKEKYNIENVKFLIAGEGRLRQDIEDRIKNMGLGNRIILTGFRPDIKDVLDSLDIFVLSSLAEGQPMVLLEAMAMAKPIVATDIGGVSETITNGLSGRLVPPRDPGSLAEAIAFLLNDSQKAETMASLARRAAEEDFNLKDKIEEHCRLYEELFNQNAQLSQK